MPPPPTGAYPGPTATVDPAMKRRLDDILVARELYHEIGTELPRLLVTAGFSLDSFFFRGREWVSDFISGLPSISVHLALRDQTIRAGNRDWKLNDLRDIGHLSVAVPYCDLVFTDADAENAIARSGVADEYKSRVHRDLTLLPDLLTLAPSGQAERRTLFE